MINLHERMLPTSAGVEPVTSRLQSDAHPTEPPRTATEGLLMGIHNMFSSRNKKNIHLIIWIPFLARAVKSLSQDKYIESSVKWDKLDKSDMVFTKP